MAENYYSGQWGKDHGKVLDKEVYAKKRAFDTVKRKSYYPFGRKKGAELACTQMSQAYRDNFDRIFGKKEATEPNDFDDEIVMRDAAEVSGIKKKRRKLKRKVK